MIIDQSQSLLWPELCKQDEIFGVHVFVILYFFKLSHAYKFGLTHTG